MQKIISNFTSVLKKYEILEAGKNNRVLILMSSMLIIGMIAGSLSIGYVNMEYIHKIDFVFINSFKEKIFQSFLGIFASSSSQMLIFTVILEFFALSFWGPILIPFTVFFRGLALGLCAGYLYFIYGLKGIAFYLLIMLPGIFISSIGLLLLSSQTFKFSSKFAKSLFSKKTHQEIFSAFKSHIKNSRLSFVLFVISALIDVCFTAMFIKFFNF